VLWLIAPVATALAVPEVIGVRFGDHEASTRVVLDVSEDIDYRVRALTDPARLVVDLPTVRWRLRDHALSEPRGLARAHRYGRLDGDTSRLVVDMTGRFQIIREEKLAPSGDVGHYRIVLDVAKAPSSGDGAEPRSPSRLQPGSEPAAATRAGENATAAREPTPRPEPRPQVSERRQAALPGALRGTPLRRPVVMLDPGHGGLDPGTTSVTGVHEKSLMLTFARELAKKLEATGRYRPVMTRKDDSFVRLQERIDRARAADADVFLSLHADSLQDSSFRGASVYTLSETASDAEAARLAAKENKADIIAGVDLSHHDEVVTSILIDLVQRDTNNKSIDLAEVLIDELGEVTRLIRNTRRYAGFVVLKSPDIPSVLLELGYLSNPTDARNLENAAHRAKLQEAVIQALDRYFESVRRTL